MVLGAAVGAVFVGAAVDFVGVAAEGAYMYKEIVTFM